MCQPPKTLHFPTCNQPVQPDAVHAVVELPDIPIPKGYRPAKNGLLQIIEQGKRFAIRFKWDDTVIDPNLVEFSVCFDNWNFEDAGKNFDDNPCIGGQIKWDGCVDMWSEGFHMCFQDNRLQVMVNMIYYHASKIMSERCDFEPEQIIS